MEKSHAQLMLYNGYTSTFSHELGTGRFSDGDVYYSSAEKRRIAMDHVHRAMDLKLLRYGIGGCLKDEERAALLIAYAEREIPQAQGLIVLNRCGHGQVFFDRTIRFPLFTELQREELLRILQQSGQKFEKGSNSLENCLGFFQTQ